MTWGDRWGTSPEEELLSFPCDPVLPVATEVWYRGISVDAPAPILFRWLCQLRVAPYSYDWIDNWGRTSPRELTPGLDDLAVGQRVMSIFELLSFERDAHLTIRLRNPSFFPSLAISYVSAPVDEHTSRLIVKAVIQGEGLRGLLFRPWFARVDLVMMKKQLKTLKSLAEESVTPA